MWLILSNKFLILDLAWVLILSTNYIFVVCNVNVDGEVLASVSFNSRSNSTSATRRCSKLGSMSFVLVLFGRYLSISGCNKWNKFHAIFVLHLVNYNNAHTATLWGSAGAPSSLHDRFGYISSSFPKKKIGFCTFPGIKQLLACYSVCQARMEVIILYLGFFYLLLSKSISASNCAYNNL
jgi:hypothetical protein